MNIHTRKLTIPGPIGAIELSLDLPDASWPQPRGMVLIAHPHPLFGGTMDNKVVQTLARTFVQLGYVAVRSNFRGVGQTAGTHDNGIGEQDDQLAVVAWMRNPGNWQDFTWHAKVATCPLALAGFSFGSFVTTHVAAHLAAAGQAAERLVLIGTATSRWQVADVPADTIVIHGEIDDTVPLTSVLDWARPQELPVVVIPGADHFFHRKLHLIKNHLIGVWHHELLIC